MAPAPNAGHGKSLAERIRVQNWNVSYDANADPEENDDNVVNKKRKGQEIPKSKVEAPKSRETAASSAGKVSPVAKLSKRKGDAGPDASYVLPPDKRHRNAPSSY